MDQSAPGPELESAYAEDIQRSHYDEIAVDFERHYGDAFSERYRDRFINRPLVANIDVRGMEVLEAMCAGGSMARFLLDRGARLTGLDISPKQMSAFADKFPNANAVTGSIFATGLPDNYFDCVVVVSGLHHVQPHVQDAIDEVHRILKPGGWFCFSEPVAGSLFDLGRRLWYRFDWLFESNEKAVDIPALELSNKQRFDFVSTRYSGNIAYLLVFNSMVFRLPVSAKRFYAPVALTIEAQLQHLQTRRTSCFAVAQWRKKTR